MLKFTSILLFTLITSVLKSQNSAISTTSDIVDENLRKKLVKNGVKTKAHSENAVVAITKSNYNNWERQILDALIVNEIPKEFPKYTSDLTDEQYKANIISWANKNPQYFK